MSLSPRPLPHPDALHQLFDYDKSGQLKWRPREGQPHFNGRCAGTYAGAVNNCGYIQIGIKLPGQKFANWLAHRVIWAMHFGDAPCSLDHINGDRADNRIENLRLATNTQQNANTKAHANGTKGVVLDPRSGRYVARICCGRRRIYLGHFDTKAEAAAAYVGAAVVIFGEFAHARRPGSPSIREL